MPRRNRLTALARAGIRRLLDPGTATATGMAIAGLALHGWGISISPAVAPIALVGHVLLWLLASAIVIVALYATLAPFAMGGE